MTKDQSSSHQLFVWIMVFASVGVLLLYVMVVTTPSVHKDTNYYGTEVKTTKPPATTLPPIEAMTIFREERKLSQREKMTITKDSLKQSIVNYNQKPLPNDKASFIPARKEDQKPVVLEIGTRKVEVLFVAQSFFLYDVNIRQDSSRFIVTILLELPPIHVRFAEDTDGSYYKYYPTINPYIHVAELTYEWTMNRLTGEMNNDMRLRDVDLHMVDWERNRYWTMYLETVNSPICLSDMGKPIQFSKEELTKFFKEGKILSVLPVEPSLFAKSDESSSVLLTK